MIITHKINMDLARLWIIPPVPVMQDDKYSRNVELTLTENGTAWAIPEGATALIRYRKSDGTGGNYDLLPDAKAAYTMKGNVLTAKLAPQVCTVPGEVKLAVALIVGKQQLHTFVITIDVERNPGLSVTSENYYKVTGSVADYGWTPNMYLGTDAEGKVVALDIPAAVQYAKQNLTETQQMQARANLDLYRDHIIELGDTLTWDGDTAGKTVVGDYVLISEDVPADELLATYGAVGKVVVDGVEESIYFSKVNDNVYGIVYGEPVALLGIVVKGITGELSYAGETFTENGLYMHKFVEATITITGHTFTEREIAPVPEKYIPSTVPAVDKATVGQIIAVKAVDENGKPTEWEAVDAPQGGGGTTDAVQYIPQNLTEAQRNQARKNLRLYHDNLVETGNSVVWDGNITGKEIVDEWDDGGPCHTLLLSEGVIKGELTAGTLTYEDGTEVAFIVTPDAAIPNIHSITDSDGEEYGFIVDMGILGVIPYNGALVKTSGLYIHTDMVYAGDTITIPGYAFAVNQPYKVEGKYLPESATAARDWNAAEGTPGHILNRTHHTEIVDVTLAEEVTMSSGKMYGHLCYDDVADCSAVTVVLDGVAYVCPVTIVNSITSNGDESYFYIGNWRGNAPEYPFSMMGYIYNGEAILFNAESGDHTVSVIAHKEVVYPLPEKFLPESVPVIQSATVGQVVVIKAVDTDGKPTEWEAVDMASGGGADWNAAEGEPGHVLNRTHWAEKVDVSFDNDLTGREVLPLSSTINLVKISDYVLTEAECVGAVMTMVANGQEVTGNISISGVVDISAEFGISCFMACPDAAVSSGMPFVGVVREAGTVQGLEVSAGTYYLSSADTDGNVFYVSHFSALENAGEVVHKLDNKFLPDDMIGLFELSPLEGTLKCQASDMVILSDAMLAEMEKGICRVTFDYTTLDGTATETATVTMLPLSETIWYGYFLSGKIVYMACLYQNNGPLYQLALNPIYNRTGWSDNSLNPIAYNANNVPYALSIDDSGNVIATALT